MRTLAVVAFPNGVSVYVGRLDGVGAVLVARRRVATHALRNVLWAPTRRLMPHRRVVGVWRERPLAGVLLNYTNRALDGGAVAR